MNNNHLQLILSSDSYHKLLLFEDIGLFDVTDPVDETVVKEAM